MIHSSTFNTITFSISLHGYGISETGDSSPKWMMAYHQKVEEESPGKGTQPAKGFSVFSHAQTTALSDLFSTFSTFSTSTVTAFRRFICGVFALFLFDIHYYDGYDIEFWRFSGLGGRLRPLDYASNSEE